MGPKTSNFQILILVVFGFFVLVGLLLFATATVNNTSTAVSSIVVWGTLPADTFNKLTASILETNKEALKLTYVQKDAATFEQKLIEALASQTGPDVILLPQDLLYKETNKITPIPYTSFPLRTFKDSFVDAGNIFLNDSGVLAVPFIIDPLVMYWNKQHFINASIVNPPAYWDQFPDIVTKLTKKDSNFNITKSAVALGEFGNVGHAKDIISTLFLQIGTPIVGLNRTGIYAPSLIGTYNGATVASALSFYTDFANPAKDSYSWNRSLKDSLSGFLSGDVSIYFGLASEISGITLKNPNLNFDVAMVPQVRDAEKQATFAHIYGLAIMKASANAASAFSQISVLTSQSAITTLSEITNLPPVRKDVLSVQSSNAYMQTFYNSALRAQAWLDPDPELSDAVFKDMVESTIAGKVKVDDAVNRAQRDLEAIFNKQN